MTYTVICEKGPGSSGAYVPNLPGAISVGDLRDEVEQPLQEAIAFHLEGMRNDGIAIPAPPSFVGVIDVDHAA
jgi:predicted RNase H-like HicB family nuclease